MPPAYYNTLIKHGLLSEEGGVPEGVRAGGRYGT